MRRDAVWSVAHRGASRDCPENTLAAFDEALGQGCDGIELDVQLSADGVPVVWHDRTLSRAGGGRRRVSRLDLEEIRRLQPGAGHGPAFRDERIPTLEEVLRRYAARTRLLLEIKHRHRAVASEPFEELARSVAEQATRCTNARGLYFLSFDPAVLRICATIAPEIPRVLNIRRVAGSLRELATALHQVAVASADVRYVTPAQLRKVREVGVPLWIYTCNTPARVEKALRAGAVAIMSNRPGWLSSYLRTRRSDEA